MIKNFQHLPFVLKFSDVPRSKEIDLADEVYEKFKGNVSLEGQELGIKIQFWKESRQINFVFESIENLNYYRLSGKIPEGKDIIIFSDCGLTMDVDINFVYSTEIYG